MGTLLRYDLTKPSLFAGQAYCWRVQAVDPSGQVVYKNQGYSTVCSFRVISPQAHTVPAIREVYAQGLSPTLGEVSWTMNEGADSTEEASYRVAYRKAGEK